MNQAVPLSEHPGLAALSGDPEERHRLASQMLTTAQVDTELTSPRLYDSDLTRMPTRLGIEQQRVTRNLGPCMIAMMARDHFKDVHDRSGHQVGDLVLTETVPIEQYISLADQALYQAKAFGRNQARLWDPSIA